MENVNVGNSGFTTHEIEEIGSIRAKNGTALETIAGAAAHWEREAKKLKEAYDSFQYANTQELKKKWRDGFLTGSVSLAVITSIAAILLHFCS